MATTTILVRMMNSGCERWPNEAFNDVLSTDGVTYNNPPSGSLTSLDLGFPARVAICLVGFVFDAP
jgi:hypothetical protein